MAKETPFDVAILYDGPEEIAGNMSVEAQHAVPLMVSWAFLNSAITAVQRTVCIRVTTTMLRPRAALCFPPVNVLHPHLTTDVD
jgi:hypothetical protein